MESLLDGQDNFGRRRNTLGYILPLADRADRAENENRNEAATSTAPSSVINLLIIMMSIPEKIVLIVEETVGWPDLHFGIREGDQVLEISPRNFRPLRSVVKAFRDIVRKKKLTLEIQYVMQNLQEYKTLLGSLLDELKQCHELRFASSAQPPLNLPTRNPEDLLVSSTNDLTTHAFALEVLLNELDAVDHFPILVKWFEELDPHIISVHQLIEFLR